MARALSAAVLFFGLIASGSAQQPKLSDDMVKIGVLSEMSGVYADISGVGMVEAVKMAAEDFGGSVLGRPIEIVSADHQSKPDIASSIARRWWDVEKVDVITDIVGSANTLAVMAIGAERQRIVLATNAASAEVANSRCTPYVVQYRSDTYAIASSTARGILAQGGDSWFIIGADYTFGRTLAKDISDIVTSSGGKVVGSTFHPLGTTDYSSYILAAQNSGAKVIAFANAGTDFINSMKAAQEFGLGVSGKQRITGLLVFVSDVNAVGLENMKGLVLAADFYWDMDEKSRSFSERYFKRLGKMPTLTHAGTYSAVTNYLKAVQATGTDDADAVMKHLRASTFDDLFARNGRLRPDGLMVHDIFLFQVKSPEESKRPWDFYKHIGTVPADEAYRPLSASTCKLVPR
ncbi:ABC transporter substrate-binding protein [Enterovirga rhinocerotis]|uniref:Branched-chain amino acid transport system substrate-binding protein n=1 Tax=Enterovirga rhinocerotis TaxID=1339210 RepID=A0A4R7C7V7_9HYPH|nr:branched-chain amino acid transport system substrate-binding protein [Enterovirga rhinocerotis]